jgi:hypothetical protein
MGLKKSTEKMKEGNPGVEEVEDVLHGVVHFLPLM